MAEAGRSWVCPTSLHIQTSSVHFGPDIIDAGYNSNISNNGSSSSTVASASQQQQQQQQQPPPRRPHPGGLDTLPEASHVNALSDATGPSPASLSQGGTTNQHIDSLVGAALKGLSPPSRSLAVARSKGYSGITIELANERWRERWSRLCLAGIEVTNGIKPAVWKAGDPGGMGGSWEVLANLSGAGGLGIPYEQTEGGGKSMPRSSSRGVVNSKQKEKSMESNSSASLGYGNREAEEWRSAPSFHRSELNLSKYEESEGVIAIISPWLELDSVDEGIRFDSEIALRQEVAYASHIGISTILLPPPSSDPACRPYLADYARSIAGCLISRGSEAPAAGLFMKLAIRLPISSPYNLAQTMMQNGQSVSSLGSAGSLSPAQLRSDDDWSWQTWNIVSSICQYSSRLSVALDLSAPLPMAFALQRWISEPVSHIWLPSRAFLANAKGYPVMSKASQALLRSLMIVKSPALTFIIVGSQNPPSHHQRGGQAAYEQYIRHLEKSTQKLSAVEIQSRGYGDYLQAPLQPLFDNLEGQTYATFEADATKYVQYEEAVYQALLSRTSRGAVKLWVCGAGRGPLVDRCLNAAKRARKSITIVALEKNVNAAVGLRERVALEWGENVVEVMVGDMRKIKPPKEKADIIVSELLGSFGDNELSPECLDGAQRFLKPDGICIPQAYTSYITPISTPNLHAKVLSGQALGSSSERAKGVDFLIRSAETPYVVLLKAFSILAAAGGRGDWAEVQDCWSFEHNRPAQNGIHLDEDNMPLNNSHNVRTSTKTFYIPNQGVCHGLAGYFEAHLFGGIVLSIFPDPIRATKDMMSWFPIFFPFKDPIYLAANSELDVKMWRMTSNNRVWYEWMAESYLSIPKAGQSNGPPTPTVAGFNISQRKTAENGDVAMEAAFQNAPLTPRIAEMGLGLPSATQRGGQGGISNGTDGMLGVSNGSKGGEEMVRRSSVGSGHSGMASSQGRVENHLDANAAFDRIKVGMSALMNVSGRSSWVGM